jgi:hypothetical protein
MGDEAERLENGSDWIDRSMREEDIHNTTSMLEAMSDSELINYLCNQGEKLNTLQTFKTFDVAKRIKDNGWTPTKKQRESLINTAAIALN